LVRAGLLPVGGGLDALMDHAAELERLRRAIRRDAARLEDIARDGAAIDQKLRTLAERADRYGHEHRAVARSEQLILAAEEREQAFRRAFESNWSPTQHTTVYGAGFGAAQAADQTFAALKGRLPFPIAGRAEIESATLPGKDPGLMMTTRPGAPVRAIFAGRVAFADSYADYGKTVIVDHGSKYHTVSAHLSSIEVQVGDEVAFGERLGTVGSAGSSGKLYFELRNAGDTLRPEAWFGL
jgi:septal ring factor EnvC (AmiA/AmiB activator)